MNDKIWNEIKKEVRIRRRYIKRAVWKSTRSNNKRFTYRVKKLNLLEINTYLKFIYDLLINNELILLRGFMDTDGYFNRKRKRCVMETTKEWQTNAIIELVSSLKYKTTVFKTKQKVLIKTTFLHFKYGLQWILILFV